MLKTDISFYLPSSNSGDIGGAQLLLLQIAEYISINYSFRVNVLDKENGSVAKNHINIERITFIKINSRQKTTLKGQHIVVCPLYKIKELLRQVSIEHGSTIFFWNLGISDYNMHLALSGVYNRMPVSLRKVFVRLLEPKTKEKLENLMKLLIERNAVAFMSAKNYLILNQYLCIENQPLYLPVTIIQQSDVLPRQISNSRRLANNNPIKIGYLGRFEKTATIYSIIKSLSSTSHQLILHIIGWGSDKEKKLITDIARKLGVKIIIAESLYGNELDNYIVTNIDIGIAMGLSLLNFARLKIPTISTEYYRESPKKPIKFKWLYDLKDYNLATTQSYRISESNLFFIDRFLDNIIMNHELYSNLCYDYYQKFYSPRSIISKFLKVSESSTLNLADIQTINSLLSNNYFHRFRQRLSINSFF